MNYLLGDDDQAKISDQMKKSKERMRNEKRFQQTNNTLRQQREKIYINGNQQYYNDEQQQIQMMEFQQNNQIQQYYAQLHHLEQQKLEQEAYEYYMRMGGRQIYDFSMVPQENYAIGQYQSVDQVLQQQYPNLSNIYQQIQDQQQLKGSYSDSIYQQQNTLETTQRKQFNYKQEYAIQEDYDNEQDEETQECYIYDNRNSKYHKQQQQISKFNDNYQQAKQYSNKINTQQGYIEPQLKGTFYNNNKNDLSQFEDAFNSRNTPSKYFAIDRNNQKISTSPQINSKVINDLNNIQLTPRNDRSSRQPYQLFQQQQIKSVNTYQNPLFEQATIIDQEDLKNRQLQGLQQNRSRHQNEQKEQKQRVYDNGYNYNQTNQFSNQKKFYFDQNAITSKENAINSSNKKINEQKNAALNFAQNQLITIKDYEFSLNKKIGEGSFSQVYLGNLKNNPNIPVAVKIIDLQKQGAKFRDEIQICMKVNGNKNILRIYDHHIEQKYCSQGNLQSSYMNISRRQAIIYFRQILEGMKELLKHNIIHRDIKLENILLNDSQVKISDFGLSKQVQNTQLDVNSIKCGTPSTMAPEIYFSHTAYPSYNNKCDVWSLGVILHEMFYKSHPFNMNKELLRKFQRVQVQNKCDIVEDFLSKCLVQSQKKRLSMEEVFNHAICKADLSKFKLMDDGKQKENEYLKQKSNQNIQYLQTKQTFATEQGDILQAETVRSNLTPQKINHRNQNTNNANLSNQNNSNSIETLSLLKSIIFDSLRGKNFGLSLLLVVLIGLILGMIFFPIFQN